MLRSLHDGDRLIHNTLQITATKRQAVNCQCYLSLSHQRHEEEACSDPYLLQVLTNGAPNRSLAVTR